jgi:acyl carrier protein
MTQRMPEQKLREVLAKIFEVDVSEVSENASPDTIPTWDSLRHMNLVIGLEQAFGIEFSDEEVVEILSYKLIKLVLREHGVDFV